MNLILKETYIGKHDGLEHVSSMKLKPLDDGGIHVWISNGEKAASFKLYPNTARELAFFLQRNIK